VSEYSGVTISLSGILQIQVDIMDCYQLCNNIDDNVLTFQVSLDADCISLLLKHGADARCSDHNGNTPLDLAKDSETKKLLQKAMQHPDHSSENSGNTVIITNWNDS